MKNYGERRLRINTENINLMDEIDKLLHEKKIGDIVQRLLPTFLKKKLISDSEIIRLQDK